MLGTQLVPADVRTAHGRPSLRTRPQNQAATSSCAAEISDSAAHSLASAASAAPRLGQPRPRRASALVESNPARAPWPPLEDPSREPAGCRRRSESCASALHPPGMLPRIDTENAPYPQLPELRRAAAAAGGKGEAQPGSSGTGRRRPRVSDCNGSSPVRGEPIRGAESFPAKTATAQAYRVAPLAQEQATGRLASGRRPRRASEGGAALSGAQLGRPPPSRACGGPRRASHAPVSRERVRPTLAPLAELGYVTVGPIASGAFSMIERAVHIHSRAEVAVKTFSNAKVTRDPSLLDSMRSEIEVLRSLQPSWHAGIANMVELLQTPQSTSILLEYCGGGSLHRRMAGLMIRREGMPPHEACRLTAQLAGALAHLHGMAIAHRDVKPDNLLYTDMTQTRIKLCDFGFAKHCGATGRLRSVCGSPQYMAPEINGRQPYRGPPVDVWAVGALVYELLHGCAAFRGSSLAEMGMRILRASHGPIGPHVPAAARGLLMHALLADPAERITAGAILRHEWMGGVGGSKSGRADEAETAWLGLGFGAGAGAAALAAESGGRGAIAT